MTAQSLHKTGSIRLLASGHGFRVSDMRCCLGPYDPAKENAYPAYRVAAIVAGTFAIRSSLGDGVPVVGSLLLGNAGDCYCCRHDTPGGDRCINFDFDAEFLERVRAELGMRGTGERFRRALIAPARESLALATTMEAAGSGYDPRALQAAACEIAAAALLATHATAAIGRKASSQNERAAMHAARYIEAHSDRACTLAELAAHAGMSEFHFLRVYRRVTGQTPYQHLLLTRLRNVARGLRTTRERVCDVAMAAGFGDLSTFNATFARHFGVTPRVYRARSQRDRNIARLTGHPR